MNPTNSTNTKMNKIADLVKKAGPYLIETGKVIIKNTADVLANPRPGESTKTKVIRVAKQTAIDLIACGIPKANTSLPDYFPGN